MEDDLSREVDKIVNSAWTSRTGQVVPDTESITLGNSCVTIEATMLYADLADSTELALYDQEIAAEVYKAYLLGTTKLIKALGGQIRSFDGDRVMGVFIGNAKNSSAAVTALRINHFFTFILEPKFSAFYPRLSGSPFKFAQSVGIDTGTIRVARAGVRNDNDLIWVGGAPNVAAKLSGIRETSYSTYITEAVYHRLNSGAKTLGDQEMWESRTWGAGVPYNAGSIYRSSWWLRPSYKPPGF